MDNVDEIILSVNKENIDESGKKVYSNTVMLIDLVNKKKIELHSPLLGHNNSSTPWIGDLTGDKMLDIVFCHSSNPNSTYAFDDMQVQLLRTNIPITKPITWGAYMGSKYLGRE